MPDNSTTPWLAGLRLDDFSGSVSQQVAQAAHSIHADVLSPSASSFETPVPDPAMDGYVTFTTREMIDAAHERGMKVKPWTVSLLPPFSAPVALRAQLTPPLQVNRMTVVEQLLDWKADGIISDCKWLSPFTATKLIVDFDFYSTQILATFAAWLSTAACPSRQSIPSSGF